MIKIVVSFDEMLEGAIMDISDEDYYVQWDIVAESLAEKFPQWDIELAFDLGDADVDWDNSELHIPMRPV